MRGNVVDLAVGVIIGGAFGKIVTSVVNDIIMPPIGMAVGGVRFTELKYVLKQAEGEVAEVAIRYGTFIQTVFDFIIVAFCIFMLVKTINRLNRCRPAPSHQGSGAADGDTRPAEEVGTKKLKCSELLTRCLLPLLLPFWQL